MAQQVLDPIPSLFGDVLGRRVVNFIGNFLKPNVAVVSASPWIDPLLPYTGKIKTAVQLWSKTLSDTEYEDINNALSDPLSGLSVLITTIETVFSATQASASNQYIAAPAHQVPPFQPATLYSSALMVAMMEIPPYTFSKAWDTYMIATYAAYGLN